MVGCELKQHSEADSKGKCNGNGKTEGCQSWVRQKDPRQYDQRGQDQGYRGDEREGNTSCCQEGCHQMIGCDNLRSILYRSSDILMRLIGECSRLFEDVQSVGLELL